MINYSGLKNYNCTDEQYLTTLRALTVVREGQLPQGFDKIKGIDEKVLFLEDRIWNNSLKRL